MHACSLLLSLCPVSIGLIWDSDASHVERIRNVVNSIGLKLTLSEVSAIAFLKGTYSLLDTHWTLPPFSYIRTPLPSQMFDSVLADDARTSVYSLKAVVTYYGKHYSTVCFHGGHQEWVYFDDTIVRTVSPSSDATPDTTILYVVAQA